MSKEKFLLLLSILLGCEARKKKGEAAQSRPDWDAQRDYWAERARAAQREGEHGLPKEKN